MNSNPAGVRFYAMTAKVLPGGAEEMTHWLAMLEVRGGEWIQQGVRTEDRKSIAERWAVGDFAGADFVNRDDGTNSAS